MCLAFGIYNYLFLSTRWHNSKGYYYETSICRNVFIFTFISAKIELGYFQLLTTLYHQKFRRICLKLLTMLIIKGIDILCFLLCVVVDADCRLGQYQN